MTDAQQPLNALPQGHRFQEYELVRVLGFGGFGMTYLGFDHNLDKAVAIKEYLPSDIATRTGDNSVAPQASQFQSDFEWGLDRFLDEARALARFDHRHIIKVHRFFEAHGTAYIVMEYAEGETLSAFLERKWTLKEAELKVILYSILDGLEVVHRADFLHRDIKPGNIIIRDEDNSPVLLDFGSARQAISARSRSVTSIITPGYAPIEQYSSRGDQGSWTDIYALGGVCYRALTGQVPEDATDRVRNDPLIPVSERCAGQVSAEFLSAIDWALAVDEGDRPQSIVEWRARLEGDLAKAPEQQNKSKKQREDQVFVAAVGRVPYLGGVNDKGKTDLHIAAKLNLPMLTISLLNQGADVNAKDNNSNTPLHDAVRWNTPETADVLLKHGAEISARNNGSVTPLHSAAGENAYKIAQVLLKHGAEINAKDGGGATPLHYAAVENAHKAAQVLLKHGAEINAKDKKGNTPLCWAALENAHKTVQMLLKHGADVDVKDYSGNTPLHYAAMNNACETAETAEVLLKYGGPQVNTKNNDGYTPLHYAMHNAPDTADILVKYGADPNTQDRLGLFDVVESVVEGVVKGMVVVVVLLLMFWIFKAIW